MNWNWISRDFGKSFGHLALKRFWLVCLVSFVMHLETRANGIFVACAGERSGLESNCRYFL